MKKNLKKVISLALSLTMMISVFSVSGTLSFADEIDASNETVTESGAESIETEPIVLDTNDITNEEEIPLVDEGAISNDVSSDETSSEVSNGENIETTPVEENVSNEGDETTPIEENVSNENVVDETVSSDENLSEDEENSLYDFVDGMFENLVVVLNGVDLSTLTPEELTNQLMNDDWYTLVTEDEIYQQTGLTKEEMDAIRQQIITSYSDNQYYTSYDEFVVMINDTLMGGFATEPSTFSLVLEPEVINPQGTRNDLTHYNSPYGFEYWQAPGDRLSTSSGNGDLRQKVLNVLHNNYSAYLSTPYSEGYDDRIGQGMNCEGFVEDVLRRAGCQQIPMSKDNGGDGWSNYFANHSMEYRTYHIAEENTALLAQVIANDGYAEPGDIVYFWDATTSEMGISMLATNRSANHHIVFYVGNYFNGEPWYTAGNSKCVWQSNHRTSSGSGNRITSVNSFVGKTPTSYATVFKLKGVTEGTMRLKKKAVVNGTEQPDGTYDLTGAIYECYATQSSALANSATYDNVSSTLLHFATFITDSNGVGHIIYHKGHPENQINASYTNSTVLDTVSTADTHTDLIHLSSGYYYFIKETRAPQNFIIDTDLHKTYVGSSYEASYIPIVMTSNDAPNDTKLKLKKSSANPTITNANSCYDLTGATYAVYNNISSANEATETNYTTKPGYIGELVVAKVVDTNNNVEYVSNTISGLNGSKYYVKEIKAPYGYALDGAVYTCDMSDTTKIVNNVYNLEVTDEPQLDPVTIALTKTDKLDRPIAGAIYDVWFYEGQYDEDVDPESSTPNNRTHFDRHWVMETDADGRIYFEDNYVVNGSNSDAFYTDPNSGHVQFPLGTVVIKERTAPTNFKIDPEIYVERITGSGTNIEVNTYNAPDIKEDWEAKIKLVKTPSNSGFSADNNCYDLAGAKYAVYKTSASASNCTIDNYTTFTDYVGLLTTARVVDASGNVEYVSNTITGLDSGTYYIKEIQPPKGFVLDTTIHTVNQTNPTVYADNTFIATSTEREKYNIVDVLLTKKDRLDARPIADAEFTIRFYAGDYAEGVDPATLGVTPKNTWVVKTNAEGKATVDDKISGGDWYRNGNGDVVFPLGTVTIQETKAPAEYHINSRVFPVKIKEDTTNIHYETENSYVAPEIDEQPKLQAFELIKLGEDTNSAVIALSGAGFSACNVADLQKDANGNYIWDDSKKIAIAQDGSKEMFTDANGYVRSAPLRCGTYIVRETTIPTNFLPIPDFTVVVEDDTVPVQSLRYYIDKRFKAYLRIVKQDKDTQKPIISDNASFKIWSYDNNSYVKFNTVVGGNVQTVDTFETVAGVIMTPDALPAGKYRVEEVKTPHAYVGGAVKDVDITSTGVYEIYYDENGRVTDMGIFPVKMDNTSRFGRLEINKVGEEYVLNDNGEWVKKDIALKGVTFGVYADEDILSTDGQGILFKEGDKVEDITTDANGYATTSVKLPEGNYIVKEITTLDDYYKAEDVKFNITFVDSVNATLETVETLDIINYKKIELGTTAKDVETEDHISKADEQVVITDTVFCKNLIVGKTYTIKGVLMDKSTGDVFKDAKGNVVNAEKTFTATKGVDYVDVTFPAFDGSLLKNKSVVVFEDLYEGEIKVATHSVLSDEGQTIDFPEIGTQATNEEGEKDFAFTDKDTITLIDTVSYKNVLVGKTYTISGVLMDKKTEKPITNKSGVPIMASAEVTPTEKNGTAEVIFTVNNASEILGGKTVVVFENMDYKGISIAVHADIEDKDQTVDFPNLGTSMAEAISGLSVVLPRKEVTLIDKVYYENLVVGRAYILKGKLMDKETGLPFVDADGKEVYVEKEFTPTTTSGIEEVTFTFNACLKKSYSVVAFEECWEKEEERLVCFHLDINDGGQTTSFPNVSITTTATSGGKKEIKPSKDTKIVDRVSYKDLPVGYTYEVSGVIMNKATGKEVLNGDKAVTAKATFTPNSKDGEVSVTYTLDTTGFSNKDDLVVYEEISVIAYADGTPIDKELVAEHKDINDKGQTIKITTYPKTGDSFPVGIVMGIGILSLLGMGALYLLKKKKDLE